MYIYTPGILALPKFGVREYTRFNMMIAICYRVGPGAWALGPFRVYTK